MQTIRKLVTQLINEEDGIVAVEYALIVAVISGLVAAALILMDFNGIYTAVSTKVQGLIK